MAASESGQPIDHLTTQVIDLVRRGVAVTRPELIKRTGLGRTVVVERVEQAIRRGLLANDDFGRSTGGRPSRLLRFRGEAGTVHAMEIGTKHIAVAVTDLSGTLIATGSQPWQVAKGPEDTFAQAAAMIQELVGDDEPWAIGVALPGPVDFRGARSVEAGILMPGWSRFDPRDWFAARTPAPVWVDNDLNILVHREWEQVASAALAEGNGERVDGNMIVVKVSNGIGAGVLSNGEVHRGRQGAAGAIGHTTIKSQELMLCRCGQVNCLDAFAAGWALVRDARIGVEKGESPFLAERLARNGEITVADIADGTVHADPLCFELLQRSATLVGETLATLVSFFNPSVLYLGGVLPDVGDLFLTTVRRIVLNNSFPLATKDLRILHADATLMDVVLGASRMAVKQLFDPEQELLWLDRVGRHQKVGHK